MHCPQCGHRQTSDKTSFCTKCGLALGDVKKILVPELQENKDKNLWDSLVPELSETVEKRGEKHWKIVSQGVGLIVFGLVLTFVLELLQDFNIIPKIVVKIAFIGFLVAGLLRIFIPFLFAGNLMSGKKETLHENDLATSSLTNNSPTDKSLPEARYHPPLDPGAKNYDTGQIVQPTSVTENTTKNLKKELKQK